ncbi:MAG: DegT/DnrJ/EryC1/StrS family aminotransferase [Candidatus Auribacter fodinae]|jgi:dTDP-4-amino-4,6-dideoxygalactose transaminase|uniref:DegT/DnrJ/EryC1/StrS family aminotransferase n=1 Tax=Candidatus Auribacter fodinae TaxID=2093366 RepID=A0A3A4R2X4_9BACT|nr:MAG: DegT/DnrJ/EryC1/StrS family aminotransferase [Candidatus Auribacter fodinae]
MNVPLLDVHKHIETMRPALMAALEQVVGHARFIMGPEVQQLEDEIRQYTGAKHAIACASGTDALLLSIKALGIGAGDEVITTPFTFFATAGAVANAGAAPVFVDIKNDTFNIDPDAIEAAITKNTKAIIPVHLFGQSADMGRVMEIAKKHGLAVIEDAAQSIGATYKNRMTGTIGDTGCFSFFPSKNLGGIGDGGLVTCNDDKLAETLTLLRQHGAHQRYYHDIIGTNSRLDTLQAAALLAFLPHLDRWAKQRAAHAALYTESFSDIPEIITPACAPDRNHVYNQYTIRVPNRDAFQAYLTEKQVGCAIYYPVCLHLQKCFVHLGYVEGQLPLSEQAASQVISLPVYPELSAAQQEYVISSVRAFFGK